MRNEEPTSLRAAYAETRRSLIDRLGDWDDEASWAEFYKHYWRLIYTTALHAGLDEEEAAEVVQETVIRIAKQSRENRYDASKGSFKGWLLNLTRWRIADQMRKRQRLSPEIHPGGDSDRDTATFDRFPGSEADTLNAVWEREWRSSVFRQALHRVKKKVSPKQFQIFDGYVVNEWPVEQVIERLGVSRTQVYLAKHRVGQQLKKEIVLIESQSP